MGLSIGNRQVVGWPGEGPGDRRRRLVRRRRGVRSMEASHSRMGRGMVGTGEVGETAIRENVDLVRHTRRPNLGKC